MQKLFFVYGKTPSLSRAELFAVLRALYGSNAFREVSRGQHYSIMNCSAANIDVPALQRRLGCTVKIGKILFQPKPTSSIFAAIQNTVTENVLSSFFSHDDQTHSFGWSLYTSDGSEPFRLTRELHRHGIALKSALRANGIRASFIQLKGSELSSVAISKEHMLDRGAEFCVFLEPHQIAIGRTMTVQDFRDFSARDYGRPGHDDVSGMLPPKLAMMMINLSGVAINGTLLDPFCGSGTILTESLAMGMTQLIGSDISERAIDDTRNNLEWTMQHLGLHTEHEIPLYVQDAKSLEKIIPPESIDAVVTEPYLGPPLRGRESPEIISNNIRTLQQLYQQWIDQFYRVLKPHGRFVMVIPHFRIQGKMLSMHLEWRRFTRDPFSSPTLPNGGLVYQRQNQFVVREIVVGTKRK
ncbi:MAG: methyltransferase domain-containing protein [Candidatus Kerfeldbacteria bacterium]|nr:methyltransferase domain-containing protein [Candidatus Kerfeldbacteria bacterium]